VCDRAGKYNSKGKDPNTYSSKQRQSTGSKKYDCLIRVELRQDKLSSNWVLKVLEAIHNYRPSIASIAYPAYRLAALALGAYKIISTLLYTGLSTGQILTILYCLDPEISLILKDLANLTQKARLKDLDRRTLI
jgi:hypothetical protein